MNKKPDKYTKKILKKKKNRKLLKNKRVSTTHKNTHKNKEK